MTKDKHILRQYEFIELILAYEGILTNYRLQSRFGIATVQASRILAKYRDAYPQNMVQLHGEGRGRYAPSSRFIAEVANLSLDNYFKAATVTGDYVETEDTRCDFTYIDPKKFRSIFLALSQSGAIKILYRSMNNPEGLERVIHPLAFAFAGRRWHVRAYDEKTEEHRDFNLARIWGVSEEHKIIDTPVDKDWEEKVELQIRAHPSLTTAQAQLVRDELFNGAAGRAITTRRALIHYVLRELEVAENPDEQHPPEYQLYLYKS